MRILKTEVYDKGYKTLLDEILDELKKKPKQLLISPSDANVLLHGQLNDDFQFILNEYDYNIPDGMPSVWIGRWKGAKKMERCYGPGFTKDILDQTKHNSTVKHYFIGGKQEVLNFLVKNIKNKIGNLNVVGSYSPPFKDFTNDEIKQMATEANNLGANFIWIGLGAPKQIYFAYQFAKYSNAHFVAPVGAAFDFIAENVKMAPSWLQKSGLEWAFRIISEPRRLGKRYLKVVPLFLFYNLIDLIHFTFKRK